MDRRKALVAAATTALTITAGSLALAANLGLLAHAEGDSVGKLNAKNVAELLDPGKGTKSPAAPVTPTSAEVTTEPAPTAVSVPPIVSDDERSGEAQEDDHQAPGAVSAPTPAPEGPSVDDRRPTAPPTVGGQGGDGPVWTAPPTTAVPGPRPTTTERPEPSTSTSTSTTTEPRDDHDD